VNQSPEPCRENYLALKINYQTEFFSLVGEDTQIFPILCTVNIQIAPFGMQSDNLMSPIFCWNPEWKTSTDISEPQFAIWKQRDLNVQFFIVFVLVFNEKKNILIF